MQRPALLQSFQARFQRSRWGGLFLFLLLVIFWRLLVGGSQESGSDAPLLTILILLAYLYALAPLPWQWTGDGRRLAPFPRGVLQALVWNSLILGPICFFSVALLGPVAIQGQRHYLHLLHSGVPPSGFLMGLAIFGHALGGALIIGWFVAREESIALARMEAEDTRRTLEAAARQAQTQALQAQLDPHVLYNALGGIAELIHDDPGKAEEALLSLSELYRALTDLVKRPCILLREERRLIADYLAVEEMRLGSRMRVTWDWSAELNDLEVPPLLVQPLVENAIKHGLSPRWKGGELRIGAWRNTDRSLHVKVMNNGVPLEPSWKSGTGLSNLAARLALLGTGSGVTLRQEGEWTVSRLDYRPAEAP